MQLEAESPMQPSSSPGSLQLTFAAGAFFTTYEGVKSALEKTSLWPARNGPSTHLPQPLIHALASSVAELVSCFILTPAEVLKQNAQMMTQGTGSGATTSSTSSTAAHQLLNNNTPKQALTSVLKSSSTVQVLRRFHHPTQLWRGYTALAARNLPFTAMQFPLFESLKKTLFARRERQGRHSGSVAETAAITAVSAGLAGALAASLTTPIDVVKTRIMLAAAGDGAGTAAGAGPGASQARPSPHALRELDHDANKAERSPRARPRPGAWTVGRRILRDEGAKALWRGGALRAVWTALGSGLYLGAYETGRTWLGGRRRDEER